MKLREIKTTIKAQVTDEFYEKLWPEIMQAQIVSCETWKKEVEGIKTADVEIYVDNVQVYPKCVKDGVLMTLA